MKELLEYRRKLIEKLAEAAHEFRTAALAAGDAFAQLDGGWNVHQIVVHTRDVNKLVYGLRARRTAAEDNPEFLNFDGEAYMAEHYQVDEPLEKILNELVSDVEELATMLHNLPPEAWSRQSRHVTLGHGFTLQAWVERNLAHIEEHLGTFKQKDV